MTTPVRASDTPFAVQVVQGKEYWWCACGRSEAQPFCDGSHRTAGDIRPVKFSAEVSATVSFCGCKGTCNPPLCDGAHTRSA